MTDDAVLDDQGDTDDTVVVSRRAAAAAPESQFDDTVVSAPAIPELVEPPRAAPRAHIDHAAGLAIDVDEPVAQEPVASADAFYAFRLGFGAEMVLLDAPCYIGRKPAPPRISTGRLPRLVRVASPNKEVSSTHLEVRQVGASVVITDLRSTNGSTVMIPGSIPRKLRQGESVVVSPGTLVDIGDGNVLQILPMQRRAIPAGRQP